MTLIRIWGLNAPKSRNKPPNNNGVFMALRDAHDMPMWGDPCLSSHDPSWLLRYGTLFMGDVRESSSEKWTQVTEISQLRGFKKEYSDIPYEEGALGIVVNLLPYPVEFYWVPKGAKANRHLYRAQAKVGIRNIRRFS